MIALEVSVIRRTAVSEPDDRRLESIVRHTLESEGADGEWIMSVVFVDDSEMTRMHGDFMNIPDPTDIMTFPSDPDMDGVVGGDLVISSDSARAQAPEFGHSHAEELEFLVVHGLLHLLGWNDETSAERSAMLARQAEILATFGQERSGN